MSNMTEVAPSQPEIPNDVIAARAYENWQQRGCPLWEEQQDWFTARSKLEREHGADANARVVPTESDRQSYARALA